MITLCQTVIRLLHRTGRDPVPGSTAQLWHAQTHEGLPVVDADGQPTKKVHAFGPKWQALYAPEYDSVTFASPTLKCAVISHHALARQTLMTQCTLPNLR